METTLAIIHSGREHLTEDILGENTIEKMEEPTNDSQRDVETPCFVKDTVRDGFFATENYSSKDKTACKTNKKRSRNRVSKESSEDTHSRKEKYNLKSERKSLPFAIAEIDSCEDSLTAVGDSCDFTI